MKNLSFYILLFVVFATNALPVAIAQTNNNVATCFIQNNEKVFIQLDRHILMSGEDLNYNCFVLNASAHKPSALSKVVYFELIDAANQSVFSWRTNYSGKVVAGSVQLPDSLLTGAYTLKAYTNWMRNFSSAFFYSTTLFIGKMSDDELLSYKTSVKEKPLLAVLPEGGNAYYGIASRVGVYIDNAQQTRYKITNATNQTVADTLSSADGRAVLTVTPQAGQVYTVHAFNLKGSEVASAPLRVDYAGYALSVVPSAKSLLVRVAAVPLQTSSSYVMHIQVRERGLLLVDKLLQVNNGAGEASILLDSIPSGIVDVCLVDNNKREAAHRLAPVWHNANKLSVDIKNTEYNVNQAVSFLANVNSKNINTQADAAIAVSLLEPVVAPNSSINAYVLFASELATITNLTDSISLNMLDEVLLTTAPQQYLWNKERYDTIKRCAYVAEHKGYVLEGKAFNASTNAPLVGELVLLSVADSIPMIKSCVTDSQGRFFFRLNKSFDNRNLILQLHDLESKIPVTWWIDSKSSVGNKNEMTQINIDPSTKSFINTCRDLQIVHAIYRSDLVNIPKAIANTNESLSNLTLKPNLVLIPAEYTELKDFEEIASNILPTVSFSKNSKGYVLRVFDLFNRITNEQNAGLLLNGIPFYNLPYLATLGTKDIQRVEVFNSPVMFGDLTFYGLLAVYTTDKKIPKSFYENKNYNFISNKVTTDVPANMYRDNTLADAKLPYFSRSLLVKNKLMQASKATEFTFNTTLYKAKYLISLQGVTQEGEPFEKNTIVEVK